MYKMVYEWKDKVVLITGAATGIGAEVVKLILEEKIKHVAILDIDEHKGVQLQNELNSKRGPNKVKFYKCDVTNEEQLLGIFQTVSDEQGLDVVINNAGIMNDSYSSYKKQIDINVTALVTGTLKAMELMGKNKGGRGGTVINISSVAALSQSPLLPIYFGTKSAVLQFSTCIGMKEHYSKTGVRVFTVCYGATDTSLFSPEKLSSFDEDISKIIVKALTDAYPVQNAVSAAKGLVEAFKQGESGSTWLVVNDNSAMDITPSVKKSFALLSEHVFD